MNEFLLQIKNCVDRLGSVSHAVSENDHIKAIFDSLTSEYIYGFCEFKN